MKTFSFNFFFPTQPGGRQEVTIRQQANNVATAFGRAWRQLRSMDKFKGRKGLDNFRLGVIAVPEVKNVQAEEAEATTQT